MKKYSEYIRFLNNNKVIFAPNSTGKTQFVESEFISMHSNKYRIISKKNIMLSFKEIPTIKKWVSNESFESWDFSLDNEKINIPYLTKMDIKKINEEYEFINIKISEIDTNLSDLVIKKGNKKIILSRHVDKNIRLIENELKISSSEFEMLILSIAIRGYININKTIILDDPIEMASWENELKFVNFLRDVNFKKSTFILLTHRITLFQLMIGIHKKLLIIKNKIKYIPSFIYFLDGTPYWITNFSSDFSYEVDKKIIRINKFLERNIIELTIKNLKSLSIFNGDIAKELNARKSEISILKKSCERPYISINVWGISLHDKINWKINTINFLREELKKHYNKKCQEEITLLSKMNPKKELFILRKNNNSEEIRLIKEILNQSMHLNNWIMYNEISIEKILNLIQKNYKLNKKISSFIFDFKESKKKYYKRIEEGSFVSESFHNFFDIFMAANNIEKIKPDKEEFQYLKSTYVLDKIIESRECYINFYSCDYGGDIMGEESGGVLFLDSLIRLFNI